MFFLAAPHVLFNQLDNPMMLSVSFSFSIDTKLRASDISATKQSEEKKSSIYAGISISSFPKWPRMNEWASVSLREKLNL